MSTDELWLLHQEIARVLEARLVERKRQLDEQLASLPRPMSNDNKRARAGPATLPTLKKQRTKVKVREDAK